VVRLEGGGEHLSRIDSQAGEQLRVGAGDPSWGADETIAVGIFPDRDQDLANRLLDPREIDGLLNG
jgi:hypothetical protein